MIGSDYPYTEFLPHKTPVIQIDERAHAIGRRVPVAQAVVGSSRASVAGLLAKVQSIQQIILGILPRSGALPPGSPELFVVQRTATDYARHDGQLAADEAFFVEQNARVITNAEQYYRTMFGGP